MPNSATRHHRSVASRCARRVASAVLAFAAVCFVASCDGSPTGNSGDRLLDAEVGDLLGILVELSLVGAIDSLPDGTVDRVIDRVGTCDAGAASGFYAVQGRVEGLSDSVANDFDLTGDVEVDFFRCLLGTGGADIKIEGDRTIRGVYAVKRLGGEASFELALTGAFSFETDDDRSGRCAVDLHVAFGLALGITGLQVEGSMCRVKNPTLTSI
ncbi:MAG: hypothetical protein KF709_04950 [Gemmatimonadaceae bacterium]|nr:hypothetical protein [Gemmatimonadaceae bacterium]